MTRPRSVRLQRVFDADVERVFRAFTSPAEAVQWWGPAGADTAQVARSYFAAWTSRQGPEALRALMAPEFVFDAGPQRVEGREAFLSVGGWPDHATTTMLAEAYDGDHAFQLYLGTNADRQVKIAEHLTVRDNVIVSSEVVVDGSAFQAFLTG